MRISKTWKTMFVAAIYGGLVMKFIEMLAWQIQGTPVIEQFFSVYVFGVVYATFLPFVISFYYIDKKYTALSNAWVIMLYWITKEAYNYIFSPLYHGTISATGFSLTAFTIGVLEAILLARLVGVGTYFVVKHLFGGKKR